MFLAHTSEVNRTYNIDHLGSDKRLIFDKKYKLISNICPHQGAKLQETGQMLSAPITVGRLNSTEFR